MATSHNADSFWKAWFFLFFVTAIVVAFCMIFMPLWVFAFLYFRVFGFVDTNNYFGSEKFLVHYGFTYWFICVVYNFYWRWPDHPFFGIEGIFQGLFYILFFSLGAPIMVVVDITEALFGTSFYYNPD